MVSAIVLTYNRCIETLTTIQKLKEFSLKLTVPLEIIVIDNGSIDNTTEKISKEFPEIKLISKEVNVGIAGWNYGFEVAKGDYFLVLDDDSHIVSGLTEAVGYLVSNPKVGILALNIKSGPYITDEWLWQDRQPWQDGENILGFFGCGAIIKKEVYEKIGGFADWLMVYAHEWEYGLRCMNAGYDIRYYKNSNVAHRASPVNRSSKRFIIYGSRNEMCIVYKYFNNRWKYIFRVWINNLKRIKSEGIKSAYYYVLGGVEFLKMKNSLMHTPVSLEVQKFFLSKYGNTFPAFHFLKKLYKSN